MERHSQIYVAGGDTLVGAALLRELKRQGFTNLVGEPPTEPDLTNKVEVDEFFRIHNIEYVFLAAGKAAGIRGNQLYPATLMLDNLFVECHVIDAAHRFGAKKLLYLASCCTYPKLCPQPMAVSSLMTGPMEPTNEAYALAKMAGITLCQAYAREHKSNFIVGIPANIFGTDDHFTADGGHVIPALIARLHAAKLEDKPTVEIWGTGNARREFLFADSLADAALFAMREYSDTQTPLNLGGGEDLSIRETAEAIQEVVGYQGDLVFDVTKPDGMPLKSLDSSPLLRMGWQPRTTFVAALAETYEAFLRGEHNKAQEGIHARAVL